ncbi:helicase C-terminal domain-domain-containing protein [Absidia repens]|uniref:DNA 5'-3' helicase n=1 Tax=Absidia repens TaxID=90262 RepID=A0A1X2ID94_9FUNG|nr:helicase C-terminal domain-domain-containing protein [Absidia repens]
MSSQSVNFVPYTDSQIHHNRGDDSSPNASQEGYNNVNRRRQLPFSFDRVKPPSKRRVPAVPFSNQYPAMLRPERISLEYENPNYSITEGTSNTSTQSTMNFDVDISDTQSSSTSNLLSLASLNMKTYPVKGVPVKFPFTPYQSQIQMISKIIEALQKEQHAVLESPTGSGKSLALLCGALGWLEKEKQKRLESQMDNHGNTQDSQSVDMSKPLPRIYVGSRTHRQVAQLVGELKGRSPYRPKMAILGSRDQYCIHDQVSNSDNKVEDCTALVELHKCKHHNQSETLLKDPRIQRNGENDIWDIEDLTTIAKQVGGCPYFASRDLAKTAELIICPYNYLVDPMIRMSMDIQISGSVIILDEAHNIENVCRESASFEVSNEDLDYVKYELHQIINNGHVVTAHQTLLELLNRLTYWMYHSSHQFTREEENQRLSTLETSDEIRSTLDDYIGVNTYILNSTLYPMLEYVCDHADCMRQNREDQTNGLSYQQSQQAHRTHLSIKSIRLFEKLFLVFGFLLDDSRHDVDDYCMVLMERTGESKRAGQNWQRKLGFWCLDPAVIFQGIAKKAHSVILTSGTLTPIGTFEAELGTDFPICLEAKHVIKPSQVMVHNLPCGPSTRPLNGIYSNTSKIEYQDDLGEAIADICDAVPFGILVFVNSYRLLSILHARWKNTGLLSRLKEKKRVIMEPRHGSSMVFNKALRSFYECIKQAEHGGDGKHDGAVFFAVYRGKVSEGIDFSNNNCRAVVATGIPFPSLSDTKVTLKQSYNDKRYRQNNSLLNGNDWYNIQGYRAINQALGRCIRHRNDWGSIFLLEKRFGKKAHIMRLSKWIRELCVSRTDNFKAIMADIVKFTQERQRIDSEDHAAALHRQYEANQTADTKEESSLSTLQHELQAADTKEESSLSDLQHELQAADTKEESSLSHLQHELQADHEKTNTSIYEHQPEDLDYRREHSPDLMMENENQQLDRFNDFVLDGLMNYDDSSDSDDFFSTTSSPFYSPKPTQASASVSASASASASVSVSASASASSSALASASASASSLALASALPSTSASVSTNSKYDIISCANS